MYEAATNNAAKSGVERTKKYVKDMKKRQGKDVDTLEVNTHK